MSFTLFLRYEKHILPSFLKESMPFKFIKRESIQQQESLKNTKKRKKKTS